MLKVYYGFTRLTKKVVRKPELSIYFENEYSYKNRQWVEKHQHIVYVRVQTQKEIMDAEGINRMFTKYGYFINEKPYFGNIEKVLEANYLADCKNVSKHEREHIKELLFKEYFLFYNVPSLKNQQLTINFDFYD